MPDPRPQSQRQLVFAKLAKAKRLVIRGFSIVDAAAQVGLTRGQVEPVCTREGWITQRIPGMVDLPDLDLPIERDAFTRQSYELVRTGLDRLQRDHEISLPQFAGTLETLVKVGRQLLGIDAAATSGAQVTVLARNAVVSA